MVLDHIWVGSSTACRSEQEQHIHTFLPPPPSSFFAGKKNPVSKLCLFASSSIRSYIKPSSVKRFISGPPFRVGFGCLLAACGSSAALDTYLSTRNWKQKLISVFWNTLDGRFRLGCYCYVLSSILFG